MTDKRFWNCYNSKHKLNYHGNIILNLLLSISNIYCTHHVAETHYTVSFHRIKWVVFNWFQPWSPTPCTNTDVSILYNRVTDHYFHTIYVFIFFEYYCYFDILLFMRSIRKRKEEKKGKGRRPSGNRRRRNGAETAFKKISQKVTQNYGLNIKKFLYFISIWNLIVCHNYCCLGVIENSGFSNTVPGSFYFNCFGFPPLNHSNKWSEISYFQS